MTFLLRKVRHPVAILFGELVRNDISQVLDINLKGCAEVAWREDSERSLSIQKSAQRA